MTTFGIIERVKREKGNSTVEIGNGIKLKRQENGMEFCVETLL